MRVPKEAILKACKKMRCDVCSRNQKTGCARPAVLPSLLDMNQLVSIDVFSVFDSNRVRHELLSIIDHQRPSISLRSWMATRVTTSAGSSLKFGVTFSEHRAQYLLILNRVFRLGCPSMPNSMAAN